MKMLPYSNFTAEEIDGYIRSVKPEQVKRSLSQAEHKFTDFLHFISPAAADLLPEMTEVSARIKRRHFGNTVRTFAPLYISSYCMNNCVYCGFAHRHSIERRTLSLEEVEREVEAIYRLGFRNILLVAAENPKLVSSGYMADVIDIAIKRMPSVSIEIAPSRVVDYKKYVDTGCEGLTVFQETYDEKVYPTLHPSGPKSVFWWRLGTPERGAEAGPTRSLLWKI